ncbi:MAG: penicillin-binding protein 2 [Hydrogenophilus sp.]|nr:penicillin-binding protein 2 [Hydrogenophilus sp.]
MGEEERLVIYSRRRAWMWIAGMAAGFALLLMRLHHLQVEQHERFAELAEANRLALAPIPPRRGEIYDRKGRTVARNEGVYVLEVTPVLAGDLEALLARLQQLIPLDEIDLRVFRRRVREQRGLGSIPLKWRLTDEEVARIAAWGFQLPGVTVAVRSMRHYPYGEVLAPVVGYVGRISAADMKRIETNDETGRYRGTETIGKEGVEASHERALMGWPGWEQIEVNAAGRAMRRLASVPPRPGMDAVLTIDVEFQAFVYDLLRPHRAAFVALDPRDGAVLALVSTPSFDPNVFVEGISSSDWRSLNEDPARPLLNRVLRGLYPPGSTFKPFMALLGLESGRRRVGQRFDRQGVFQLGSITLYDRKASCQGGVDLIRALAYSCNVYFYQLGTELGIEAIHAFMSRLGFGQPTGIDLPNEASGVLPSREWKRRRFKRPREQQWFAGETVSVAIGQGYTSFTPMQMAYALMAVVNGGVVPTPHVVSHYRDGVTGEVIPVPPRPSRFIPLNPNHVEAVISGMVEGARVGTSARAFVGAPYKAGGKTGTAQVVSTHGRPRGRIADEEEQDHAWYIAFAPASNPKIVAALVVEHGGFGGATAAPLMRLIFDRFFGVNPTLGLGEGP